MTRRPRPRGDRLTGATRAGRRRWHPAAVGGGLFLAAAAVLALRSVGSLASLAAAPLAGWLLVGLAAGFATSGST